MTESSMEGYGSKTVVFTVIIIIIIYEQAIYCIQHLNSVHVRNFRSEIPTLRTYSNGVLHHTGITRFLHHTSNEIK
jgi:hypothetical protein